MAEWQTMVHSQSIQQHIYICRMFLVCCKDSAKPRIHNIKSTLGNMKVIIVPLVHDIEIIMPILFITTDLPGSIVVIHSTGLIFSNKCSHRPTEEPNSDLSEKPHLQPLPHQISAVTVRLPWVQAGICWE